MIDAATAIATRTDLLDQVAEARRMEAAGVIAYSEVTALLDAIRTAAHPNHLVVAPSQVRVGWVLDCRSPETSTVVKIVEGVSRTGTPEFEIHTGSFSCTLTDEHLLTLTVREEEMPF